MCREGEKCVGGGNKGRDRGDENRDGVGGYKDSDVGSKDEREI